MKIENLPKDIAQCLTASPDSTIVYEHVMLAIAGITLKFERPKTRPVTKKEWTDYLATIKTEEEKEIVKKFAPKGFSDLAAWTGCDCMIYTIIYYLLAKNIIIPKWMINVFLTGVGYSDTTTLSIQYTVAIKLAGVMRATIYDETRIIDYLSERCTLPSFKGGRQVNIRQDNILTLENDELNHFGKMFKNMGLSVDYMRATIKENELLVKAINTGADDLTLTKVFTSNIIRWPDIQGKPKLQMTRWEYERIVEVIELGLKHGICPYIIAGVTHLANKQGGAKLSFEHPQLTGAIISYKQNVITIDRPAAARKRKKPTTTANATGGTATRADAPEPEQPDANIRGADIAAAITAITEPIRFVPDPPEPDDDDEDDDAEIDNDADDNGDDNTGNF